MKKNRHESYTSGPTTIFAAVCLGALTACNGGGSGMSATTTGPAVVTETLTVQDIVDGMPHLAQGQQIRLELLGGANGPVRITALGDLTNTWGSNPIIATPAQWRVKTGTGGAEHAIPAAAFSVNIMGSDKDGPHKYELWREGPNGEDVFVRALEEPDGTRHGGTAHFK